MLIQKRLALAFAGALLVAACGGGGGGGGGGDPATGGAAPDTGGSGNVPPDSTNPDPQTSTDTKLEGYLSLVANQVAFISGDRKLFWGYPYNGAPVEYAECRNLAGDPVLDSQCGLDIAAGGTQADMDDPAVEVKPSAIAPAAPIASFGFRILNEVLSSTGVTRTGAQKAVGRVAFDFTERPASVAGGERAERMTFIIDKVELETNAQGVLIGARALQPNAATQQEGAKVYVTGTNAAGISVSETIPAAERSVRLMPMDLVADSENDPSSKVLLIDLEQAFSQAGQKLAALHGLQGEFDVKITLSPASLVREFQSGTDTRPEWPRREFAGPTIEMAGHAPVTGAGMIVRRVLVRHHDGTQGAQQGSEGSDQPTSVINTPESPPGSAGQTDTNEMTSGGGVIVSGTGAN